jgi:threonine/homoserine/homoserine lactone efflux protein
MTVSFLELGLYALALLVLFLTPGPVWLAVVARTMSGGFRAAFPLALGVALGDLIWPLVAILGVSWLVSVYGDFLIVLKWLAVAMFLSMGLLVMRHASAKITADNRLTRPGIWAGFGAGFVAIAANPKAALFYMGLLPSFFDMARVTGLDIALIVGLSVAVPFFGNLLLALLVDQMRQLLSSATALRRANLVAGWLLIVVAVVIAIT